MSKNHKEEKKEVVEIPEEAIVSREEVVAEMGEEAVAKIEAEAEVSDAEVVIVPKEVPETANLSAPAQKKEKKREECQVCGGTGLESAEKLCPACEGNGLKR